MKEAGHTEAYRRMIITRILARYQSSLKNHQSKTRRMYRNKAERVAASSSTKTDKSTWFRKGGYTNTLAVPVTPGGSLAEMVKKFLEKCPAPGKTKTKVVERGGRSVRSELVRNNPFPRSSCGRSACPLKWQQGGCQDKCYKEQIGYAGHCRRCRDHQLQSGVPLDKVEDRVYHGESSRTLYTRAQQHRDDYVSNYSSNRKPKGSWMWDHVLKEHGGLPGPVASEDFTFRLVGTFRDCLGRQTDEAVRLELTELLGYVLGDRGKGVGGRTVEILNRRGEYFQPKIVQHLFYQQRQLPFVSRQIRETS